MGLSVRDRGLSRYAKAADVADFDGFAELGFCSYVRLRPAPPYQTFVSAICMSEMCQQQIQSNEVEMLAALLCPPENHFKGLTGQKGPCELQLAVSQQSNSACFAGVAS